MITLADDQPEQRFEDMNDETQTDIIERMVSRPGGCCTADFQFTRVWAEYHRAMAKYRERLVDQGGKWLCIATKITKRNYRYTLVAATGQTVLEIQ